MDFAEVEEKASVGWKAPGRECGHVGGAEGGRFSRPQELGCPARKAGGWCGDSGPQKF